MRPDLPSPLSLGAVAAPGCLAVTGWLAATALHAEDAPTMIHVPQWGCALMIAAVVLLVAVIARAVRRAAAAQRRATAERLDEIQSALEARGFATEHEPLPAEIPDLDIVPSRGRPASCLRAKTDDIDLFLFEHVHPGSSRPPLGRNAEQTGSGGESSTPSYTSRHTVACLRHPGRSWPEVELLPSIGGALRRAASGDLAVDGDDSPLADKLPPGVDPQLGLEMAEKLLGAVGRMADSRTPVPLDGHPDLATDYVAYGSDAAAIADVLSDPIAEWLIAHPGTIVCLSGEWLLVSRNVRVAGVPAGKGLPSGFLPPAVAADLAVDAVALGRLL